MPTVAELEQQLKQAKEAEAKQAQAREAELAQAKRQAEIEKTNGYMQELATKLKAAGITCEVNPGSLERYRRLASLNIPELGFQDVQLDTRGGGYYAEKSYQITVGSYGNRKVYPLLKSGTFKYDVIVEDIKQRIAGARATAERHQRQKQNRAASEQIKNRLEQEFGLADHNGWLGASETDAEKVMFTLKTSLTETQARTILQAAKDSEVGPYFNTTSHHHAAGEE